MPLDPKDGIGSYIKDFKKSKAPQFKGKSVKKRRDMAIAAYLDAKDKSEGAYGYEKQDPDIDSKKRTQPAKYHKGLSKSTKQKRDAHFKAKKGDSNNIVVPSCRRKSHFVKHKTLHSDICCKGQSFWLYREKTRFPPPHGATRRALRRLRGKAA